MEIINATNKYKGYHEMMDYMNDYTKKDLELTMLDDLEENEEITHLFIIKIPNRLDGAGAVTDKGRIYTGKRDGNLVEIRNRMIKLTSSEAKQLKEVMGE